jgi:hypothetical protein
MMKFIVFTISLLASAATFAQKPAAQKKPLTPAQQKAADARKNAVGGFIRDARYRPLEGVQAFIYPGDSANTIIASGYTDATGHYETNSVMPGKYNIRIFYPSTNKGILISGVMLKKGVTDISLRDNPPAADTSINILFFQPKPVAKPKAKK